MNNSSIASGTDTNVNGRVSIVGNASSLEHELANGYNSGDKYTGRTGNNLTLAEWQEVSIFKFNSTHNMSRYPVFMYLLYLTLCNNKERPMVRETHAEKGLYREKDGRGWSVSV